MISGYKHHFYNLNLAIKHDEYARTVKTPFVGVNLFGNNKMKVNFTKIGIFVSIVMVSGCQTTGNSADKLYNQYRGKTNNKAFSIGTNGVAGAAWGAASKSEAMKLAQKTCVDSGGFNCSVTEINGRAISNQSNNSTVNNYNITSQGVSYKPNLLVQSSGFFVNSEYILTTSKVVDACSKINYERSGRLFETTVVRVDRANNIAVLKALTPNKSYAHISSQKQTTQGELALYPVVTNHRRFDVGIVSNVNKDSIKSSMFTIFLNELNIDYKVTKKSKPISPAKIAEASKKFSVPLVCLNEA